MNENDVEFSDPEMLCGGRMACDYPCSSTTDMERFLEEMMRSTHNCTHTHTCNPGTGPDNKHTHTCYHTHTQLLAPDNNGSGSGIADADGDTSELQQPLSKKKRPVGNREAVKKYREKKKAHTAQLEEQVRQLKVLQAQLIKRLQGQAALEAEVVRLRPFEAEVMRLRSILSEFRGRIDGELGSYAFPHPPHSQPQPLQERGVAKVENGGLCNVQPLADGFFLNSFPMPCDAEMQCLHQWHNGALGEGQSKMKDEMNDHLWLTDCEVGSTDCQQLESRDALSSPGCTTFGSEDVVSPQDCSLQASNVIVSGR